MSAVVEQRNRGAHEGEHRQVGAGGFPPAREGRRGGRGEPGPPAEVVGGDLGDR